jgi:threonine dehydratase
MPQTFTVGEAAVLPTLAQIESAAALVHAAMPPTPQFCWPLLSQRASAETWVKHENHTPVGAFKLRGGLVYMEELKRRQPDIAG